MSTIAEMSALLRIVDLGSFARAAEDLAVTPSALSKLISRLEDRLGVSLLTRTTRRLALTGEGELYLARARQIVALVESAEAEVTASRGRPKGHLRIDSGTAVSGRICERIIPEFLATHPEITIELTVADRIIDPIAENVDVALRTGPLSDSTLVARKLADLRRVVCAAPSYLERHGRPQVPADLLAHNCLILSRHANFHAWPFASAEGINRLQVSGNFSSDNVGLLLQLALRGEGIIRLADFVVGQFIRDGRLIELLADVHMSEALPLWALSPAGRHRLPRVRAFIDFVAQRLTGDADR